MMNSSSETVNPDTRICVAADVARDPAGGQRVIRPDTASHLVSRRLLEMAGLPAEARIAGIGGSVLDATRWVWHALTEALKVSEVGVGLSRVDSETDICFAETCMDAGLAFIAVRATRGRTSLPCSLENRRKTVLFLANAVVQLSGSPQMTSAKQAECDEWILERCDFVFALCDLRGADGLNTLAVPSAGEYSDWMLKHAARHAGKIRPIIIDERQVRRQKARNRRENAARRTSGESLAEVPQGL